MNKISIFRLSHETSPDSWSSSVTEHGVFTSRNRAEDAKIAVSIQRPERSKIGEYTIGEYTLNEDNWTQGFVEL
jgi:hypothetical protein